MRPAAQSAKASPTIPRRPTPQELQYRASVAQFESGVKHFNRHAYDKARPYFERLASGPIRDLAERARVYLTICNQRLANPAPRLKTVEDFYNYGVSLANRGNPQEAEQYLTKALRLSPKSDYLYYALASTFALREMTEAALENLQKAIELNERNRYLAQNDADFSKLEEDPRFNELIYPEKPFA